jgi:hypothetical protein
MSYSVSNLFQSLGLNANPQQTSEDKLFNPDLPMPSKDFKKLGYIKDQSFKSLKLPETSSRAYNGSTFLLPRNVQFKDPKKQNFMVDESIDPNNIRALQNPIKSIPNLWANPNRYFGVSNGENSENNAVNTLRSARRNYVNYKNRFEIPDLYLLKPKPFQVPVSLSNSSSPNIDDYAPL